MSPARFALAPRSGALVALLAAITAIAPLATDLYLPALPAIEAAFGSDPATVQWTLSGFTLGLATGTLLCGPLSDRFGRRPVLLVGAGLFIVTSAACAFAPSVDWMILARTLQGFFGAALPVVARAVVRDVYDGAEAGRTLATMAMIMGLTPAVAPAIGGALLSVFTWQANFLALTVYGVALVALILLVLPETLRVRRPIPGVRALGSAYGEVARSRAFRAYALMGGLSFSALFAFISGSSYVLQQGLGLSPAAFGLCFGVMVLGFLAGTLMARRWAQRHGIDGTIARASLPLVLGAGLHIVFALAGVETVASVVGPQVLIALGTGLMLPQTGAGAMMPFPHLAGTASALQGWFQLTAGALVGVLTLALHDGTARPMALIIGLCALAAVAVSRASAPLRALAAAEREAPVTAQ